MGSTCAGAEVLLRLLAVGLAAGVVACSSSEPPSCAETGVCAPREVCDRASGVCRPAPASLPELTDVGRFVSAAAGPDGTVHVAARAEVPPALVAGRIVPDGLVLELEAVVEGEGMGLGTSVAVGPDGEPRIAFFDAGAGALRLATFNGTNWAVETVERGTPAAPVGRAPSLGFDAGGGEVVAYRGAADGELHVAVRRGRRWQVQVPALPGGDGEGGEEPGAGTPPGGGISVAITSGRPVIAHSDGSGLEVLLPGDAGWHPQVLAEGLGRASGRPTAWGPFVSAAVDTDGNVGVAFQDATSGTLRVAWNDRGTLLLEHADDGRRADSGEPARVVGAFAALAFDSDGRPQVAYQDAAVGALLLATRGPDGWSRRVLDASPVSGHGIALVQRPGGRLVVVHRRLAVGEGGEAAGALHVLQP